MKNINLPKKINLIKRCAEEGFLLHGSRIKVKILTPFQANDYNLFIGNFKAVYATNQWSSAITKALVSKRKTSKTFYIYICKKNFFTKVSNNQFICLFPVIPDYTLAFRQSDVAEIQRELKKEKDETLDKISDFSCYLGKGYLENANDFLINSELHGPSHAGTTAAFGAILSRKECPEFFKEIMIGCFFHDIGRTKDNEGRIHALKSAIIAKNIIKEKNDNLNYKKIIYAIQHHTDGETTKDKIIGCIWDADRLGMIRMHRKIAVPLLSTPTAKKTALTLNNILDDQLKKKS